MHTRQHKAGQENAVNAVTFCVNAIEKYEKRYGFVHVLSDVLKQTMGSAIDAPGTIRAELWSGLFHWRKAYQPTS